MGGGGVAWHRTVHLSAASWNNSEVNGYRLTKGSVSTCGLVEGGGATAQAGGGAALCVSFLFAIERVSSSFCTFSYSFFLSLFI